MKTGISSNAYTAPYGVEKGFYMMREHGYECADWQDICNVNTDFFKLPEREFEKASRKFKAEAAKNGIMINQAHGPWGGPEDDFTEESRKIKYENVKKAIRGSAYVECPNFVIHNVMPFGWSDCGRKEEVYAMNTEFFNKTVEYAKEYGVTVCLENMPMAEQYLARPADMLAFVRSFEKDNFRMCLDTGHCAVHGISPADSVRLLGKEYLKVLHVHDNNGVSDLHWLPYTGVIDWADFTAALLQIGFDGCLSLETHVGSMPLGEERDRKERELARAAMKLAGR